MGLVSPQQSQPGETIEASDINNPINTLAAAINGNLDSNNISSVSGTKLVSATVPGSAFDATTRGGWISNVVPAVNSVSANGNRSYDVTHASTCASILTPGMRVRFTRTSAAPTQCTSLNGSTQYYSKSSPNKLSFTDDFAVSAWVKLSNYSGATANIVSRYNGTSGWQLYINASGQVVFVGRNGASSNFSLVSSYQSIPLNKWVHVAAQLDMSAFSATSTTSYVMLDGLDVPASVSRGGTNPIALAQAGDLQIGAGNSIELFPGKIGQVAIYNAKVTQANIRATISQGLTGSETSLASAYSFNNSVADLNTTTPNDLTANGSAVATNADSPFGVDANGTPGSYEFGIVTKVNGATVTYQVPEGNALPTSGGISAVDYCPAGRPFGMPVDVGRWMIESTLRVDTTYAPSTINQYQYLTNVQLAVPVGGWKLKAQTALLIGGSAAGSVGGATISSSSSNVTAGNEEDIAMTIRSVQNVNTLAVINNGLVQKAVNLSTQTTYYALVSRDNASLTVRFDADNSRCSIFAEFGLL